jgi:hypothetical protein
MREYGMSADQEVNHFIEYSATEGANFAAADFRLWLPHDTPVAAATVLIPGSNEDGRPMVSDITWQQFARRNRVALVGCRFLDRPHEPSFIEEYVNAPQGSGAALLEALDAFSTILARSDLARVPLLLWGMSAGGEFNYEFVGWMPDRVLAFVVNKGGVYYSALLPEVSRRVPGLLFIGEKDLVFRNEIIRGLFAVNRRAGALWALTPEPEVGHAVGSSFDAGQIFFQQVLLMRVVAAGINAEIVDLSEISGFVCDLETFNTYPAGVEAPADRLTSWVPDAKVASVWRSIVTETKPRTDLGPTGRS